MSKINFYINLDKSKQAENEVIKFIKFYADENYMSQVSVIKILLKKSIQMNILGDAPINNQTDNLDYENKDSNNIQSNSNFEVSSLISKTFGSLNK